MLGTIQDWAKRHGISRVAAYKRIKAHSIPWAEPGRIDMEEADRIWRASRDVTKLPGAQAGGEAAAELHENGTAPSPHIEDDGMMSTKGRVALQRDLLRIKREKLTIDQMEGKLVPLVEVREFEAAVFAQAKTNLESIAPELRDDLAACIDPDECERMVSERIRKALLGISQWRPKQ